MANYQLLKADIDEKVYQNGKQEITGENLNSILNTMVASLGVGYQFMGVATPTNPGTAQTPDYKCFYLATIPGTYTNLGGLVVADGEVAILKYDSSWTKEVTGIATAAQLNQLCQELGISKLRNGSIGNSANLTDVTTEVMPSFGMNEVYISIRRKNLDGYKYVISACSTDNANDLHNLVMRSELSGPVHTPTILNENVAALYDLPNTMGVMFSIQEQSISDSSVINPLRTTDFNKDDIVINGLTPTDIITRRLIENNTNRVVALETSKQTPTKISVSGNNDTYVSGSLQITSLLVGHIYRVYIDTNVDMSGVTVTGAVRFEIKVGATSKYKVAIGESLPQYVDVFIDESDSGNLYIGGRCTLGTDINAYVQDFTYTLPLIRNERIKSAVSVTNWVYGKFIGADGTLQDSVNWKKSNPIRLLKGQTIFVTTNETSGITNARWKIIETDQNESFYDFIAGTRTPAGSVETVSYTAPKDMYVICQTTNALSEGMIIGSAMVLTYQSLNVVELNDVKKTEQRFLQLSRTIKGGSLDNIRKNLILAHFSDLHENTDNLNHIIQYCDYWGQYIDDILSTGDNVANSYNQTSDAQYAELWNYTLAQKVLNCIGNHDTARFADGAYDWTYYVGAQAYSRYFAPYISQWGVTHDGNNAHCYYYKDYTSQKVRLIVIDVMGWNTAQLNWLVDVLSSAITNGLQVVIASHYPADMSVQECTFTSLFAPAFGTSVINEDALSAVDTFISNGGVFVAWLTGHVHRDYIGTITNHPNQLVIAISTASGANAQSQFDNVQRTKGTKSYDLFNIISIDTYNQRLSMFRVGADLDMYQRHIGAICYDYHNKRMIYND